MAAKDEQVVTIDGHRLTLTNLSKVLYPETGTTKRDVIAYYAAIAPHLIPHARNRPVTRKRWVHGVGSERQPGQVFFQKNLDNSAPAWVPRGSLKHSKGTYDYPLVNDLATLTWLAQIASLEIHVPQWQFGRTGAPRNPDRMVLDLDPGEGAGLPECVEVATLARRILTDMGLDPYPVTSGSKGIHLYAALDGRQTSDQVSAVAHELARALEADHPDLIVSDMKKALRAGKVLVDWSQNNGKKTTIAPYSLRGRHRPTVAVPRSWEELDAPDLRHLDYREVMARMEGREDPMAAVESGGLGALEPTREHLDSFQATPESRDRLAKYRSMRDKNRTAEPVPDEAPGPSTGRSFVVQEHHARRLHYDFRLEHDGVLVSWAVPKGLPTDPKQNHLAVQTEDHPLEYGTFEGTIPAGEYGGGEVTIWEAGEYEEEKWRDGREVIVTLHGTKGESGIGSEPRRYALIHTSGAGGPNNWLMHLMDPAASHHSRGHRRATSAGAEAPPRGPERQEQPEQPESERQEQPDERPEPDGQTEPAEEPVPLDRQEQPEPPERPRGRRESTRPSGGGRTADPRARTLTPMSASLGSVSDITDDEDWAFEMKWDGIRALAYVEDGEVRLVSRNGNDLTNAYPELAELGTLLGPRTAVLDGEIVALHRGRPDFGRLQSRMNLIRAADIERARAQQPVHFLVFDLLEEDGRSLVDHGYDERRDALHALLAPPPRSVVQVPPAFEGDLEAALESSRALRLEGVVAKKRHSTYAIGRRSRAWVKLKHSNHQEVVIAGWQPGKGRRSSSVGSLLLGVPSDDGLRYVGKVGTGFREAELEDLVPRLTRMEQDSSPLLDVPRADSVGARWVTPTLVGEVEFAEWTSTGRLRQPSWRGWRPDKDPEDVVEEGLPR
jgi:bifunctional non-homologous end joining protein LigD